MNAIEVLHKQLVYRPITIEGTTYTGFYSLKNKAGVEYFLQYKKKNIECLINTKLVNQRILELYAVAQNAVTNS